MNAADSRASELKQKRASHLTTSPSPVVSIWITLGKPFLRSKLGSAIRTRSPGTSPAPHSPYLRRPSASEDNGHVFSARHARRAAVGLWLCVRALLRSHLCFRPSRTPVWAYLTASHSQPLSCMYLQGPARPVSAHLLAPSITHRIWAAEIWMPSGVRGGGGGPDVSIWSSVLSELT